MYQQYLNFSFAPVASPLKKLFQIELYKDTYFSSNSKHITTPTVDQASCRVNELAMIEHQELFNIPSAAALFKDTTTTIPSLETNICAFLNNVSLTDNLNDKLFFIQFAPEGTMCRRWYLIQVDIASILR